ncbi:BamA/TamA family outer membrane protein, partial [Candidatus Aerophobetes bacterium]|nr:BamA/TamA family outer membrane protein [Candidatus Aerophobetes bacterium]
RFYDADEGYVKNVIGGEISLGRPWFSNFNVFINFKRETSTISEIEGKALPEDLEEGERTYQSLKPGIAWDSRLRDEVFSPYAGFYALLSVEKSGGFLGGDVDFTKYSVETRNYFRYGRLWTQPTLALRLRGRWGVDLPIDEQFYVGGQDTLRGYMANEFRGSQVLLGTAEFRVPLSENFLSYLFLDAGNISNPGEYEENFRMGYGFGIRMNTPLGPIRLDYGIGDEGEPRFYFGMGDIF